MNKFFVLACSLLMLLSIGAGAVCATEEKDVPVLLADGSVICQPWYVTVDGKKAVLVESREAAEEALDKAIREFSSVKSKDRVVLDIEIDQKTNVEPMKINHGDKPPTILTVNRAKDRLIGNDGGEALITVITTEEQTKEEVIEFDSEYKSEPELLTGERVVETPGREGSKEITKKIVKENGRTVEEEVTNEKILKEPQEQVVLEGTGIISLDSGIILRTPVDSVFVSSPYGMRWGRLHSGIDFALSEGSTIYAAENGRVCYAGYSGGYGNMIKIDHNNGMVTCYAHCSGFLVKNGQTVTRGQPIGLVGSTGNSTGPHLHFEVIINGNCVNPQGFLDF